MTEQELKLMLVKLAIAQEVETSFYGSQKTDGMKLVARIYGVDVKAVEKKARAEHAEKATKAPAKKGKKKADPEYIDMLEEASE